jgi:hypothetical protein
MLTQSKGYPAMLKEIKDRIRSAQYQALKAVNKELIALYWDIGRMIVERQKGTTWGKSIVKRLAKDSGPNFPESGAFRNRTSGSRDGCSAHIINEFTRLFIRTNRFGPF